jgi:uncharacterized membrane protein
MAILILLNNFLHDFSAAGWLFGSVLLWSILRNNVPDQGAGKQIADILKTILLLMKLSLGGIVLFGIIRAVAYSQYEWNVAAGDSQVTLLIVKHVILTAIFVLGVVYYTRAGKFIKRVYNDKNE